MNTKTSLFLMILLLSVQLSAQSRIDTLTQALKYPSHEGIMVIAHRGDWRNAPENSLQAIQNCIDMGVDMVEIDVRMTKDSVLVLMHDETLDRTTTGIGEVSQWTLDSLQTLNLRNGLGRPTHHRVPTLEEALSLAQGQILVNLDKCYAYFDQVYEILQKTTTVDHVVMKGKVSVNQVKEDFGHYLEQVFFMPIIVLHEPDAVQTIAAYQKELSPIAYEFVFKDEESPIIDQFEELRQTGASIWVNTLWASLNAGYEDDQAFHHSDSIYGWYIRKGVNMLQTDRPALLLKYLRQKGLHD